MVSTLGLAWGQHDLGQSLSSPRLCLHIARDNDAATCTGANLRLARRLIEERFPSDPVDDAARPQKRHDARDQVRSRSRRWSGAKVSPSIRSMSRFPNGPEAQTLSGDLAPTEWEIESVQSLTIIVQLGWKRKRWTLQSTAFRTGTTAKLHTRHPIPLTARSPRTRVLFPCGP